MIQRAKSCMAIQRTIRIPVWPGKGVAFLPHGGIHWGFNPRHIQFCVVPPANPARLLAMGFAVQSNCQHIQFGHPVRSGRSGSHPPQLAGTAPLTGNAHKRRLGVASVVPDPEKSLRPWLRRVAPGLKRNCLACRRMRRNPPDSGRGREQDLKMGTGSKTQARADRGKGSRGQQRFGASVPPT